jgi:MFS family permease
MVRYRFGPVRERLRVLRHHDFRNLWLAQSTSAMGDGVVIVALALFVTDLTGDPTEVGIVLGAQMLPLVSFLLIGGVWADRLPRARLMLATDVGQRSTRSWRR